MGAYNKWGQNLSRISGFAFRYCGTLFRRHIASRQVFLSECVNYIVTPSFTDTLTEQTRGVGPLIELMLGQRRR